MNSKEKSVQDEKLPEYVDPEIIDIEDLDIGGYIELVTKEEEKKQGQRRRAT